LINKKKKNFS